MGRIPRHGRSAWVVLAVAALLLVSGCGRQSKDQGAEVYLLDPPDLADLEPGEVTSGIPVLCYHYFRSSLDAGYLLRVTGSLLFGLPALSPKEFWTTPAGEFERHLQHFLRTGTRVMTLDEVAALLREGSPLPPRAVVLTIDDADRSAYELAFPLLQKYGLRAHLFVPTGAVDHTWRGLRVCSWPELREMQDSGLVILGSHTNRLHFKTRTARGLEPISWVPELIPESIRLADLQELKSILTRGEKAPGSPPGTAAGLRRFQPVIDDLVVSRSLLRRQAGAEARWLSWPYGFGNGDLDSVAMVAGFAGSVSLHPRTFDHPGTPWHVGRFTLTAKTTLEQIERLFPAPPIQGPSLARGTDP